MDKLLGQTTRSSTSRNYLCIWWQFNRFLINLDVKPHTWENRVQLFLAYKIDHDGMQSATVKSYVSVIKKILVEDGHEWEDKKVLVGSLTKACKLVNDKVHTRLPIGCSLLEMILFEVQRIYGGPNKQPYLEILFKALFAISYYGLMWVSEITASDHVVKAKDVQSALNKIKIKLVLYSLKTHSVAMRPQTITITSNISEKSEKYNKRYFCPFKLVNRYIMVRKEYCSNIEPFFVYRDGSPVTADQARSVLCKTLVNLGLNPVFYRIHSFCMGRTSDLIKYNYSIEEVKHMG